MWNEWTVAPWGEEGDTSNYPQTEMIYFSPKDKVMGSSNNS